METRSPSPSLIRSDRAITLTVSSRAARNTSGNTTLAQAQIAPGRRCSDISIRRHGMTRSYDSWLAEQAEKSRKQGFAPPDPALAAAAASDPRWINSRAHSGTIAQHNEMISVIEQNNAALIDFGDSAMAIEPADPVDLSWPAGKAWPWRYAGAIPASHPSGRNATVTVSNKAGARAMKPTINRLLAVLFT